MPPPGTPVSGRGAEAGEEPRNQTKAEHFKHLCRTQSVPGRPPRSPGLGGGDTHGPLERGGGSCQQQRLAVVARGLRWVPIRNSFGARQLLLCWGSWGGGPGAPLLPLAVRFAQLESVCAQRGGQGMAPLGQGVLEGWLGLEQRRAPGGAHPELGWHRAPPPRLGSSPRGQLETAGSCPPHLPNTPRGLGRGARRNEAPGGGLQSAFSARRGDGGDGGDALASAPPAGRTELVAGPGSPPATLPPRRR